TRDIYHVLLHKEASDRELVWVGRATVIAIALIAWYLSTDQNSSVLKLVAYAWAGFGAAFGPLVILSLYNPNITRLGAIAGMIAGSVTVIIWKQLEGGVFDVYELLPGFVAAWVAILVFSRIGKKSSSESQRIFDEVQTRLSLPR
ncbi:MAG: sodium:proline symporter, partial [Sulfuricurvum sp.]